MDIERLEEFLNYQPIFEEDPQFLLHQIKKEVSEYMPYEKISKIDHAYEFAKHAHWNQKRLSWEPYFVHPIKSTQFLMKIKPWIKSIQTCILHDVIEDTEFTYEDIKKEFWEEVANLCYWLEKVSKVRYKGQERNTETLKKTFLGMGRDLRVIFVKLADRIHNIQTLKFHPKEEKRVRIAQETLKIYVPIAQRLWLSVFQNYLENWAFYNLNNKEFKRIFSFIKKKHWKSSNYTERWIKSIEKILNESKIEYEQIQWRLKSPYRIYRKLKKYWTNDPSKIMDILAFRVVTKSISDCYSVLWVVNNRYTPLIKRIKDYIALPKSNWYKSLHTTIIGMFDFPVEIQIRTKEMDEFAEYWVAAHFAYKETWDTAKISEKQSERIHKLQNIVKNFQETSKKDEFEKALHIDILEKNIFVYTPEWDIVELPQWSTVLDFAFKIHTDVWLKFKNAIVDDKIVPIDYQLKNWSIVKINTYKSKFTASPSWINFVHSPSSKSKLNRFIRQNQMQKHIEAWEKQINEKLKEFWLPLIWTKKDKITKKYKWEEYQNIMVKISEKQITATKLIKEVYPDTFRISKNINNLQDNTKSQSETLEKETSKQNNVIIDWNKKLEYSICPECKPTNPDKIIWKADREWIKVHNLECTALKRINYEKLLQAHWEWEEAPTYTLKVKIRAYDKPWVLIQILSIFSDFNVNVSDIQVNKNEDLSSNVEIYLEFQNPSKMHFILKELKNRENLLKLISKKII